MSTIGLYAGSFDPPTNGHVWMIQESARLFDKLVVSVGINPDKKTMFSLKDRLEMLSDITKDIEVGSIVIGSFEGQYLVDYAKGYNVGATHLVRGIRNSTDYEFERQMRHVNFDLNPKINTVFLMPPRDISELSSSLVKGLIGPNGWREVVQRYVPDAVYKKFIERFGSG